MGDRVAVLKFGLLQQVDTPRALYDKPANSFVAGFIGSPAMNLLEGDLNGSSVSVGGYTLPIDQATANKSSTKRIVLGVRPEHLEVSSDGIAMTVNLVEELG